ncbi:hypothetical protein MTO96_017421 [Rhipicephalus appendiculatus]
MPWLAAMKECARQCRVLGEDTLLLLMALACLSSFTEPTLFPPYLASAAHVAEPVEWMERRQRMYSSNECCAGPE